LVSRSRKFGTVGVGVGYFTSDTATLIASVAAMIVCS